MKVLLLTVFIFLFQIFLGSVNASATEAVVHPSDDISKYPLALLKKALEASGKDYKLVPSVVNFPQTRSLTELAEGSSALDVVWTMTSEERESQLIPIRIPIYKGLFGWRIPLIHKSQVSTFNDIDTLKQLQQLKAGQKVGWPDIEILEHNGFLVTKTPSFTGTFQMLATRRIDYFPRSILEVWQELDNIPNMNLIVDRKLLIYYPTAIYYFVNKTHSQLADDITLGLNKLIANGEFNQIFYRHYGDQIQNAKLNSRIKFSLTNPILPAETPLDRTELWF